MNIGVNYSWNTLNKAEKFISNTFYAGDLVGNLTVLYPSEKSTSTIDYASLKYVDELKTGAILLKEVVRTLLSDNEDSSVFDILQDTEASDEGVERQESSSGASGIGADKVGKVENADGNADNVEYTTGTANKLADAYNKLYTVALDNADKGGGLLSGLRKAADAFAPALAEMGLTIGSNGKLMTINKTGNEIDINGVSDTVDKTMEIEGEGGMREALRNFLSRILEISDDVNLYTGKYMGLKMTGHYGVDGNRVPADMPGALYDIAV